MEEFMETARKFGEKEANAIMEAAHFTYKASRGKKMVKLFTEMLQEIGSGVQFEKADTNRTMTRIEIFARLQIKVVIEAANFVPDISRKEVLEEIAKTCAKRLWERIGEIQPKEAEPAYKKARYEKK